MPALEVDIIEKIATRLSEIEEFLRENREVLEPQKHVDVFSPKRAALDRGANRAFVLWLGSR
jgi:hypothetical protein